jgi:alkylhydroperoxidase family enzyme
VFDEAAKHYDEAALGVIVFAIATINAFNRLNVITGQVTGDWVQQWVA